MSASSTKRSKFLACIRVYIIMCVASLRPNPRGRVQRGTQQRQVFWLVLAAAPSRGPCSSGRRPLQWLFLPCDERTYSCGTAPDSHRLPLLRCVCKDTHFGWFLQENIQKSAIVLPISPILFVTLHPLVVKRLLLLHMVKRLLLLQMVKGSSSFLSIFTPPLAEAPPFRGAGEGPRGPKKKRKAT